MGTNLVLIGVASVFSSQDRVLVGGRFWLAAQKACVSGGEDVSSSKTVWKG